MTRTVRVAVLQYCAGPDQVTTLPLMRRLITEAADRGAVFICLPECANFLEKDRAALQELAEDEASSQSLSCLQELAKKFQIYITLKNIELNSNYSLVIY